MYTRLLRFAKESRGVFVGSQLVKVFLLKIYKYFFNLAMPMFIMDHGGRTTLVEAFAIVELCDHTLY